MLSAATERRVVKKSRKGHVQEDGCVVLHRFIEHSPQGEIIAFACVKLDHPELNLQYVFNEDKMNVRETDLV